MTNLARLRTFVQSFTRLVDACGQDEDRIFADGRALLAGLVAHDDWLPGQFAQPHPQHYRQYLLHCDPLERFSVVSFVWGPGQNTPLHDHTVWGMIGVMRGAELCEEFGVADPGNAMPAMQTHELRAGQVDLVSPSVGDIHRVSNAAGEAVSVSIHVYGGNIGAIQRHTYDPDTGRQSSFVSGYANGLTPNLWM